MGRPRTRFDKSAATARIEAHVANVDRGVCVMHHAGSHCTPGHVAETLAYLRHWCDYHQQDFAELERRGYFLYSQNMDKERREVAEENIRGRHESPEVTA